METQPFEAEDLVWEYRFADVTGNKTACANLRELWRGWQCTESLHQMAWSKPISTDALARRRKLLRERLETVEPDQVQAVRAQLAWLEGYAMRYQVNVNERELHNLLLDPQLNARRIDELVVEQDRLLLALGFTPPDSEPGQI